LIGPNFFYIYFILVYVSRHFELAETSVMKSWPSDPHGANLWQTTWPERFCSRMSSGRRVRRTRWSRFTWKRLLKWEVV